MAEEQHLKGQAQPATRAPEPPSVRGEVELRLGRDERAPPPLQVSEVLGVLARAGVLFFRFSPGDGLTFLTPNVAKVLGYTQAELVGDPDLVAKVVDPEFIPNLERVGASFFEIREEALRLELPFIAKNGSRVMLEVRVVMDVGPDGKVRGFFGIAVDPGTRRRERGPSAAA